ncbi:MAG: hypothetical protein SF070_01635 [Gemmatimonadota bacterium]|nr:hypothetical protein [Gemmatimonadota bacterium]
MPGTEAMDREAGLLEPAMAGWLRRALEWIRAPRSAAVALAVRPRVTSGPGVQRRAEPAELRARVAERIRLLADAARTSYENFLLASCYVSEPAVSAWLSDCARQRRWIARELSGLLVAAELPDGPSRTVRGRVEWMPPWKATDAPGTALEDCALAEAQVVMLHEELLSGPLPAGLEPILVVQLLHLHQVRERLLQLCPAAGGPARPD